MKITDEEMQSIKTIQEEYTQIGVQLVQLKLAKKSSEDYLKKLVEEEESLNSSIEEINGREKKLADRKWNNPNTGQHVKDQMLREGYVPDESKSPMEMRDDRIYRHAIKGGPVRKNMIKGGYIPPNER